MGVHKTTEHESGYFEDDDDDEDEGGTPVQFTPQQIHRRSDGGNLEAESRGESVSESIDRDRSCFYPICLEDNCWCFEGRTGNKGMVKFKAFRLLQPPSLS